MRGQMESIVIAIFLIIVAAVFILMTYNYAATQGWLGGTVPVTP